MTTRPSITRFACLALMLVAACQRNKPPSEALTTEPSAQAHDFAAGQAYATGDCNARGLTAFCDDVFSGPNMVAIEVRPSRVRPGERVSVSGESDCGDGTLDVGYGLDDGRQVTLSLRWRYPPSRPARFSGGFVVPPNTRPQRIQVVALAFCLDASYENHATAELTVLPPM